MQTSRMLAAAALTACSLQAQALSWDFEGSISSTAEVVLLDLTLPTDSARLWLWTDSFDNHANFDPMVGVWRALGDDWQLVDFNDDRPDLAPGQTYYDAGLVVDQLGAGSYRLSISRYANFPVGQLLSQGFQQTEGAPLGEGGFYALHVSDVSPVPEPAVWALMLGGVALVSAAARRRRHAAD